MIHMHKSLQTQTITRLVRVQNGSRNIQSRAAYFTRYNSTLPSTDPKLTSSTTEETRKVVQAWLDLVKAQHYDKLDTLATPDANWWVAGSKDKIPVAGDMPYKERQRLLGDIFAKADWYTTDLVSFTVEGDSAVVEVLRKAQGPGSHSYENTAINKFKVKDGKIIEVREYIDWIAFGSYIGISGILDLILQKKD